MTSEDHGADHTDETATGTSNEEPTDSSHSSVSDDQEAQRAPEDHEQRPLLAGVIGLLAGIAGGIAGTTIAPDSLLLTIVLVIGVAGIVTLGALRLLARRG